MKVAIIEPLGIERQSVEKLQQEFLSKDIEVVYYDTAPKNDTEKIKRSEGAQIIMLANMPLGKKVLEKCPELKMISVAFTGVFYFPTVQQGGQVILTCIHYNYIFFPHPLFCCNMSI